MPEKLPGEFEFIRNINRLFLPLVPSGTEGIGDDCAVIPLGDGGLLTVTTDMLVEGTHFLRHRITAFELGFKSLAVNLSDAAAMGATPAASFLSIALPADIAPAWAEGFLHGYKSLSEEFGVPLLGGDTTSSQTGLTVNVTVLGKVSAREIKRRNAARAGDAVCVTGVLGDSAVGLKLLTEATEYAKEEHKLIRMHHTPKTWVKEGTWLGTQEAVHAMMDVSDGIASDLRHILNASGVGARIELSRLPLSPEMTKVCRERGWNPERAAAEGGEDYVLLFTADAEECNGLQKDFQARFGAGFTVIGEIAAGKPGIEWYRNGIRVPEDFRGYEHF